MQVEALQMTPVAMSAESHLGESKASEVKSFGQYLGEALGDVNNLQKDSDRINAALASGQLEDVSQAVIASEKATMALQLTLQDRNLAKRRRYTAHIHNLPGNVTVAKKPRGRGHIRSFPDIDGRLLCSCDQIPLLAVTPDGRESKRTVIRRVCDGAVQRRRLAGIFAHADKGDGSKRTDQRIEAHGISPRAWQDIYRRSSYRESQPARQAYPQNR